MLGGGLVHNQKLINGSAFSCHFVFDTVDTCWVSGVACPTGPLGLSWAPTLDPEVPEGGPGVVPGWPGLPRVSLTAFSCRKQAFLADSMRRNANTRRVLYHAPDCRDALLEADMWRLQPVRRIH